VDQKQLTHLFHDIAELDSETAELCPDEEALIEYVLGDTSFTEQIEAHLRVCVACRETVQELRQAHAKFSDREASLTTRLRTRLTPPRLNLAALTRQQAKQLGQALAQLIARAAQALAIAPPPSPALAFRGPVQIRVTIQGVHGDETPVMVTVSERTVTAEGYLAFSFRSQDARVLEYARRGYRISVALITDHQCVEIGDAPLLKDGSASISAKLDAPIPMTGQLAELPETALALRLYRA